MIFTIDSSTAPPVRDITDTPQNNQHRPRYQQARLGPKLFRGIRQARKHANRNLLVSTLLDKGSDELLDALQDMPRIGYIRIDGGLGYDLHYAHVTQGEDGGERIVLATDRRIGFWEATNQPRSIDYPFTVIELRLNRDGEGQGKMSLATRITADKEKNSVTLENYDQQPVLLQSVKRDHSSQ